MKETDWPRLGPHYTKPDRQQGQSNRSERDGEFLLPRLIEEFGDDPFTLDDCRDAFDAYVPTGDYDSRIQNSRKLNIGAGLNALVEGEHIQEEDGHYQVTDQGRAFTEHMDSGSTNDNYD